MESDMLLDALGDAHTINVERALGEFRAARPVIVQSEDVAILAFPAEGLTERFFSLVPQSQRRPRLVVPKEKVRSRKPWPEASAAVRLSPFTLETVETYLDHYLVKGGASAHAYGAELSSTSVVERAALLLANLSLLLPAVVVMDVGAANLARFPILAVNARDIFDFRDREAKSLKMVARTVVPLEGVDRSEFVIFRGGDGFRDQVAVIVSNPPTNLPVLVRIHSACLTGDLFGSLKCDCGEQLRGTVRAMSEQGGGIILYLDQEGRGNGIANKIRAYGLQDQGFDTYDADELLGFGQDQRRFDFAAEMLKQLGYGSIRLMTNNPQKIDALREAGLDVVSTHRVLARPTSHNVKYLLAKRDKAGHLLGDAALDGLDLEDVVRAPVLGK